MNDWLSYAVIVSYVLTYVLMSRVEAAHKKEIEQIHLSYKEERAALLDRIMANNITEFKTARQDAQIIRSESGNFLKDRMTAAMKHHIEE